MIFYANAEQLSSDLFCMRIVNVGLLVPAAHYESRIFPV